MDVGVAESDWRIKGASLPVELLSADLIVADTLRNHHGIRHLNLPERVADRYSFESLVGEDQLHAALPGDDISSHPGNVYASNPFFKPPWNPLKVRRIYVAGRLDKHPRLKKAAEQYLICSGEGVAHYDSLTGAFVLRDSVNGPADG